MDQTIVEYIYIYPQGSRFCYSAYQLGIAWNICFDHGRQRQDICLPTLGYLFTYARIRGYLRIDTVLPTDRYQVDTRLLLLVLLKYIPLIPRYLPRYLLGYYQDITRIVLGYYQDITRILLGYYQDITQYTTCITLLLLSIYLSILRCIKAVFRSIYKGLQRQ